MKTSKENTDRAVLRHIRPMLASIDLVKLIMEVHYGQMSMNSPMLSMVTF